MNGKCFCLISFILAVNFLSNARGKYVYGAIQFSPFDGYTDPKILENIVAAQLRAQYSNMYGVGVYEYQCPLGGIFGGLRNLFWNTVSRLYPMIGSATNTAGKKINNLISHSRRLRRRLSRAASYGLRGLNTKSVEAEESDEVDNSDEDPEDVKEDKKKGSRKKKQSSEEPSDENSDEDNEDDGKKNKKDPKKGKQQKPSKKEENLDDLFK
ncbi:WD40/YVTN repeat-like-containing domain [Cinara cedri]|uniref:WD40/YVTN repeat-like-containing domain n=1 Tax=Cinara cedri TaxID=506608 RepID=A0A5E4MZQ4_9HEMI|nr:WD40/YVTN repeat-like-containing domain [Cinara cedri]